MRDDLWYILNEEVLDIIEDLPDNEEFWLVIQFGEEEANSPISILEDAPDSWRLN